MAHTFDVSGTLIDVSIAQTPSMADGILPILGMGFSFNNRGENVCLTDFIFRVYIKNSEGRNFFLKYMDFDTPSINLSARYTQGLQGFLILDHYLLSKIEEIREGGDVRLHATGSLIGEKSTPDGIIQKKLIQGIEIPISIPKSDWVEKILPFYNFKDVHLIEIPRITSERLQKISNYLDSAWKQKHVGQYDKVLTDCRLAVEEIRRYLQSQGFTKENSEGQDKIDWKSYFGSESIGEIFGKIDQQIYQFTSIAAHPGKSINLEDADYALLITYAAANYVIKKM